MIFDGSKVININKGGGILEGYENFSDIPHGYIFLVYQSKLSFWLHRFQGVSKYPILKFRK